MQMVHLRRAPGPRPTLARVRVPAPAVTRPIVRRAVPPPLQMPAPVRVRGAEESEDRRRRDAASGLLSLAQGVPVVPAGSRLPRPAGPAAGATEAAPRIRAAVARGSRLPRPNPSRQD